MGIAGHKTLPSGAVRGLLTVYDANMETYSSFSEKVDYTIRSYTLTPPLPTLQRGFDCEIESLGTLSASCGVEGDWSADGQVTCGNKRCKRMRISQ